MVQTILSALAPIVFTLLLGFVAAWRHDFGPKEASVLNRMVLLYAVPLALFVGTVGTPRADLVQDIAFVVAIFAAIVGLYALVFLLFRFVFRFSLSESVLAALTACRLQNRNRFDSIIVGVVEERRSACAGPGWPALTRLRRPHRPRGGADDGHPSYADRDRACRPIPCVGSARLLCPISQRDWFDIHNRSFHRSDTVSASAEGYSP